MQTSLKRLGFQFSTRYDMSAKFPRGGGVNPFSAIRLITMIGITVFSETMIRFSSLKHFWVKKAVSVTCDDADG